MTGCEAASPGGGLTCTRNTNHDHGHLWDAGDQGDAS